MIFSFRGFAHPWFECVSFPFSLQQRHLASSLVSEKGSRLLPLVRKLLCLGSPVILSLLWHHMSHLELERFHRSGVYHLLGG